MGWQAFGLAVVVTIIILGGMFALVRFAPEHADPIAPLAAASDLKLLSWPMGAVTVFMVAALWFLYLYVVPNLN